MGRVSRQNRFRKKTKEGVYQPHRNTVYCAISYLPKPQGRRGDGAAERAGLENRRWGNSSASSNLAPSANQSEDIRGVLQQTENRPNCGDIREFDWTNDPSQRDDCAGPGILSLWGLLSV